MRKKFNSEHERTVRGASVHDTMDVKKEENEKAEEIKKQKEKIITKLEKLERQEVETSFLIPKIDNFIETPDVKDIEDRVKLWLTAGYPVHIIGPTGCGKTTVATKVAMDIGRPMVWINGDEQVTTADLIGGYSQVEVEGIRDKYVHKVFKSKDVIKAAWVDNPLTTACKYGYTLVYNEFSRTKPAANNVLLSVLEEGILELPTMFGEERYVKVHPNFNLILTSNSVEYTGVHRPQDALLDRTIGIYMDFYDADTEVKIIKSHTGMDTLRAEGIVNVIRDLRKKFPDAEKPGTRACIMAAKGMMAYNGHSDVNIEQVYMDIFATKVKSPDDLSQKMKIIRETIKKIN